MELIPKYLLKQFNVSRSMLKDFRCNTSSCDVDLVCDDEKIPAHRQVLRMGSKYFNTLFSCDMKEASSSEVIFPTIRKESMEIILDFIYLQNLDVEAFSDEQILDLIASAHLLQIHPLVEVCADELSKKINAENWPVMLINGQKYSSEHLGLAVAKYLAHKDLSVNSEMLNLDFDCFNVLITKSVSQKCHSADMLVKFIYQWVDYNRIERKQFLTDLFSVINFASVSKNTINALTKDIDLFKDNPELALALLQKLSEVFNPNPVINTINPKLIIFAENFVFSFDLTKKAWSSHNLIETLMPDPSSPMAVSEQIIYYVAEAANKCSRKSEPQFTTSNETRNNSQRATQMRIVAYYPYLNCGNEVVSLTKKTNFGMVYSNNALYIAGGITDSSNAQSPRSDHFDCLDLKSKTWSSLAPLRLGRQDPSLVTLDNNLYLLGGKAQQYSTMIREVDIYTAATNQWTVVSSLYYNICDGCITVVPCSSKIYLTTKAIFGLVSPSLYEFDPKDNSWKEFDVGSYGVLCSSSKTLPFLVFMKDGSYYQMEAREKKFVFVTRKTNLLSGFTPTAVVFA